jgi:hypothetical protein
MCFNLTPGKLELVSLRESYLAGVTLYKDNFPLVSFPLTNLMLNTFEPFVVYPLVIKSVNIFYSITLVTPITSHLYVTCFKILFYSSPQSLVST